MKIEDIFLTVAEHLLTQNGKSYSHEKEMCMYRAPNGAKCAVGCLIPDEKYHEDIENLSVPEKEVITTLDHLDIDDEKIGLLEALREIHDYTRVETWKKELTDLGVKMNFCRETLDKLKTF